MKLGCELTYEAGKSCCKRRRADEIRSPTQLKTREHFHMSPPTGNFVPTYAKVELNNNLIKKAKHE